MSINSQNDIKYVRVQGSSFLKHGLCFHPLRLQELTTRHTDCIVRWRNDPNIGKWFNSKLVVTRDSHETWLERQCQSDTDVNWIILHETWGAIGAVSLYNIDWTIKSAEFGRFMIGEPVARGSGFGLDALRMVLSIASVAGLDRIRLEVKPNNERAISLYKKAGFKLEESSDMAIMSRSVLGYSNQIDASY